MGRTYWSSKTESDYLLKLNIYWLRKNDYFSSPCVKSGTITWTTRSTGHQNNISIEVNTIKENKYIKLIYTQTDRDTEEKKDFDYQMSITTTPCHFGGHRYWFECGLLAKGRYCGRRVATLYKNGDYFGCRHCHNLSYSSRNVNHRNVYSLLGKMMEKEEKAEKIRGEIKRQTYRGQLTKKMKKLVRLSNLDFSLFHSALENI